MRSKMVLVLFILFFYKTTYADTFFAEKDIVVDNYYLSEGDTLTINANFNTTFESLEWISFINILQGDLLVKYESYEISIGDYSSVYTSDNGTFAWESAGLSTNTPSVLDYLMDGEGVFQVTMLKGAMNIAWTTIRATGTATPETPVPLVRKKTG